MSEFETDNLKRKYEPTLCWCCAKATGGCNWSDSLKPVKGWSAYESRRDTYRGEFKSLIITACPEFVRDAIDYGLKRYKGDSK